MRSRDVLSAIHTLTLFSFPALHKLSPRGFENGAFIMFRLILFFIVMPGIGFAAGYGVRERISRRRRAIAREQYFERHPEARDVPA